MSDYIVKLISKNPFTIMSAEKIQDIKYWLKEEIPAGQIEGLKNGNPQFVDCGSNLERISCPLCTADISLEWWGAQMDSLYADSKFKTLLIETPCCHKNISLNDLNYYSHCGFSCIEFDIYNPVKDIEDSFVKKFEEKSGIEASIIRCRL